MKRIISITSALLVAVFLLSCNNSQDLIRFPVHPREPGVTDVLELRCEPLDTVRIAFIGLGMRGSGAVYRYTFLDGVRVVALCDVVPENVDKANDVLTAKGFPKAGAYTGPEDWKRVCERADVDLVYVCTHWDLHAPIGVYAMEHGKHVALEVPAALTVEQCWQLVNTAEKTRRHCIQLENCNYDFFEMATLNMAQQGLFGEIVHTEGAYIHDLRSLNFREKGGYWDMWRLKHNERENGNLYPTHGLGPIAHILNIHRGDRMDYLVSVSSAQFGMTAYARETFGEDSDYARTEYLNGDMNTSVIRTVKGKIIMLQHDVTSPRPYSRLHTISGTKGFAQKYPRPGIALEPDGHRFLSDAALDSLLRLYEHPIVREVGQKAKEVGGHGGMDFIMDYRLVYCLRNGLPLDMDVYDAAEWSAIIELSRTSVANNGRPVCIPDFTRGAWERLPEVKYFRLDSLE
ncbi:MAG: Gfo/Idh/MocA family oxidoreductase [Bacteroidales bacterium]|nr:Gfo/Idh/MocA family oxidoreductase [Bacteroidales bacterium]MDD2264878.1 Gfo/Idh/MocA family oxidoreductase [Bacteroidales bacterium]MDD2831954.1 Gfo/Idh/MocA family oxidoreductase [Bacteroidales bacterium]MDD4473565.1 Gfo/Idh/MocA family oxidoreductase [Bacteroidales bacterium]MDD5047100.1 Gfo/Idh/MocA family oxidoreductase [Bacteroidales bacterium]